MKPYHVISTFPQCPRTGEALPPVHGAPTPARKTVLAAQMLTSSRWAQFLTTGTATLTTLSRHSNQAAVARSYRYVRSARAKKRSLDPLRVESLVGRLVSVEIEYYPTGGRLPTLNALQNVSTDGSLRETGREIRRISWANRDGRLAGVLGLAGALESGRIDKACGLHVHVDARHLGTGGRLSPEATYDRLVSFYPFLKKLVPRSRLRNRYCEWVNNREGADSCRCPSNGERYAAINWQAFRRHRTIEFRCQSGSTNAVKIESWALLCQFLVHFASLPESRIPTTWAGFVSILPDWLGDWAQLRKLKLAGMISAVSARSASGAGSVE